MFKLESIWDKQKIVEHIMNSYNEDISLVFDIEDTQKDKALNIKQAWSIHMIIYQYIHTLRRCFCKYDDNMQTEAFNDLKDIISHNIVGLVNECKMLVKSIDFNKNGKAHNQTTTRPYNNSQTPNQPDNIILDNIGYSDLSSMLSTINFVKQNSTYLKKIYQEISTIVVMLYEGR